MGKGTDELWNIFSLIQSTDIENVPFSQAVSLTGCFDLFLIGYWLVFCTDRLVDDADTFRRYMQHIHNVLLSMLGYRDHHRRVVRSPGHKVHIEFNFPGWPVCRQA